MIDVLKLYQQRVLLMQIALYLAEYPISVYFEEYVIVIIIKLFR